MSLRIVKQRKNAIYHKLHLFFLCIFVWIASSFCLRFFFFNLCSFSITHSFYFSLFVWFCSFGRLSNIFVYVIELALMLLFLFAIGCFVCVCVRAREHCMQFLCFHSSFNLKQNANNCKTNLDSYNNCYTSHKWTENGFFSFFLVFDKLKTFVWFVPNLTLIN